MFCLGVNYRTCPIEVREAFSVPPSRAAAVNKDLVQLPCISQCVLLSTCNRAEIYAWSYDLQASCKALMNYFLRM